MPCHNGGTCLNGYNNFTCVCPPGFVDYDCLSDEDECEQGRCIEDNSIECIVRM